MAYSLITISDHELGVLRPADAYTQHIRTALESPRHFVVVQLRPDMPASVELLDAIERWVKLCQNAGRQLIVAAETAEQFECLELSHPDQGIVFIAPGTELESAFGAPEPGESPHSSEAFPSSASTGMPAASDSGPAIGLPPPLWPVDDSRPETLATHGTKVAISGEYECMSCEIARTWLKGDIITDCENKECLDTRAGYRLTFDLF